MTNRYDFDFGPEGFVFSNVSGHTNGYWSGSKLRMDGWGTWGVAQWRIEFPRGVYSVAGVSTVKLGWGDGGNCFTEVSLWNWAGQSRYQQATSSPWTYTATVSEEIRYAGVWCNIHNDGFYAEYIELDGITGLPGVGGIYTSDVQLGSGEVGGIFTNGVQLETRTGGIFTNNTRLSNG